MQLNPCPCGSVNPASEECCSLYLKGIKTAPTAEALMRSRYKAYITDDCDYLLVTTHPSEQKNYSKLEVHNWAISNKWQKLEIIKATANTVEFKAYYLDNFNQPQIHHEKSNFLFEGGKWFYIDGEYY